MRCLQWLTLKTNPQSSSSALCGLLYILQHSRVEPSGIIAYQWLQWWLWVVHAPVALDTGAAAAADYFYTPLLSCCAVMAAGGARSCGFGACEAAAADALRGHACPAATRPSGSGQPAEKPPAAHQVGGLPSCPRFLGGGKGAAWSSHCWWLQSAAAVLCACGELLHAVKGNINWENVRQWWLSAHTRCDSLLQ